MKTEGKMQTAEYKLFGSRVLKASVGLVSANIYIDRQSVDILPDMWLICQLRVS